MTQSRQDELVEQTAHAIEKIANVLSEIAGELQQITNLLDVTNTHLSHLSDGDFYIEDEHINVHLV